MVLVLEECYNLIDCFIISIQKIFVSCMNVDEIIGSSIMDILYDFLQLEVHCFKFIAYRSGYTGKANTDIVEESVKHCVWVYIHS